jgi:2-polyprenyl-3-methyl-5-hydroxy-6-metoxy-1,4-benzoquinol methylase
MIGRKTIPITRREYFKEALQLAKAGKLVDLSNRFRDETFRGGLYRFSRVAYEVRNRKKVLDIGPGDGLLLSLLHELGRECYAIDRFMKKPIAEKKEAPDTTHPYPRTTQGLLTNRRYPILRQDTI